MNVGNLQNINLLNSVVESEASTKVHKPEREINFLDENNEEEYIINVLIPEYHKLNRQIAKLNEKKKKMRHENKKLKTYYDYYLIKHPK